MTYNVSSGTLNPTQSINQFRTIRETLEIVRNLHVNFTTVVYSPTNITSLFYPVSKFSYFSICDTPLNCYYFTHRSHPCAHLTSFRRLQNSLSKTRLIRKNRNSYFSYLRYVVLLCIADRLSTIKLSKNRMHRMLKLNLNLNKPITPYTCAMF